MNCFISQSSFYFRNKRKQERHIWFKMKTEMRDDGCTISWNNCSIFTEKTFQFYALDRWIAAISVCPLFAVSEPSLSLIVILFIGYICPGCFPKHFKIKERMSRRKPCTDIYRKNTFIAFLVYIKVFVLRNTVSV